MVSRLPLSRGLPQGASIRASVLQPVMAFFGQNSNKLRRLLEQNGLDAALVQDPYAPIPLISYLGLYEDAASVSGDPILGARLGHGIRPGDLGPVGLLVVQAGTIRRGLGALARFTSALQSMTNAALHDVDDVLIWSYRIETSLNFARRQDSEFTLACACGLIRAAFDARWRPLEVHFEHPSIGQDAALEKLFGALVRFGQPINRILVDATGAARHRRAEDKDLILLIERHLSDLMAVGGGTATAAEQVQSLIGLYMGVRPVDLENLAAGLKTSPRSLQRRLAAEGQSVRALVEGHRMQMAARLLSEGGMSVEAIADVLGYADGTAFWRAYKQWTGLAPSQMKRRARL